MSACCLVVATSRSTARSLAYPDSEIQSEESEEIALQLQWGVQGVPYLCIVPLCFFVVSTLIAAHEN